MIDEYYTFKIFGYHSDDLKPHSNKLVVSVCDDCNVYRTQPMRHYRDLCISCAHKTRYLSDDTRRKSSESQKKRKRFPHTDEHRANISKSKMGKKRDPFTDEWLHNMKVSHLREREPLPVGWKSRLSDITNNKECSIYLGGIAETILSNIYKDVRVMPPNNHGFDIICNQDKKIDIKSAATGDNKGYWNFNIHKNQIADYFLCIAFNNRNELYNPVYLWLIPGHVVNHLHSIKIYKSIVHKWCEYSLPLDKILEYCDRMKTV